MERRVGADALIGERRDVEDVRPEPGRDVPHGPDGAEGRELEAGKLHESAGNLRGEAEEREVDKGQSIRDA